MRLNVVTAVRAMCAGGGLWCVVGASGLRRVVGGVCVSVGSSTRWNIVLSVATCWSCHGATSVSSLVAWASIVMMLSSQATSTYSSSAHLGIVCHGLVLLVAAKSLLAGAGSVVVGWTWAVTLLFLVLASEQYLHGSSAEEEQRGDDRDRECGGVELAGCLVLHSIGDSVAFAGPKASRSEAVVSVGRAISDRSVDVVAMARSRASTSQDCDGNHAARKEEIKDDGQEGKECNAAETACQNRCCDGV